MTKRNYKLTENLEFRTPEHDETGVYFKGEFMRVIGGAEGSLIDEILDLERRLAEANALLDDVYQYTNANGLANLGASRVHALIYSHKKVTAQANRLAELVEYSANFQCDNEEYMERADKALKEYRS